MTAIAPSAYRKVKCEVDRIAGQSLGNPEHSARVYHSQGPKDRSPGADESSRSQARRQGPQAGLPVRWMVAPTSGSLEVAPHPAGEQPGAAGQERDQGRRL